MVNEVTTIDTNNYAVMAKAMGMSGESSSSDENQISYCLDLESIIVLLLVQMKY